MRTLGNGSYVDTYAPPYALESVIEHLEAVEGGGVTNCKNLSLGIWTYFTSKGGHVL